MVGRTPHEAVTNFYLPLQKAVDCVTRAVLDVGGGYYVADKPHILSFVDAESIKLSGDTGLRLRIIHWYYVVEDTGDRGPWKVATAGYSYALRQSDECEIISFHWHPKSESSITFPHLHLGPGAEVGLRALATAHIPTGRIAIEDVLRLAIIDFGVKPRREDWQDILNESQAAYEEWRTWSGSGMRAGD